MSLEEDIRKFALHNAIKFNGKANPGAIIGKLIAADPKNKQNINEIAKQVNITVKEVNKLSVKEQTKELENLAPELLHEEKKEEKKGLPDLEGAKKGEIVTRLPPEPSKYMHVGHALSFLINYMYAEKYEGRCILKFEDTNPEKVEKEFADAMIEDIVEYLGIKVDKIIYISDDLDYMIEKAEELIKRKEMYVCTCSREKMRDLRHKGKACSCRNNDPGKNKSLWDDMKNKKFKEGEAVLRLRGDMESDNHVMRDPVMWRISFTEHFRQKNNYCVWPLYDFENAVEDCKYGVTHIFRSSEFGTMRNELQNHIKELFGWKKQKITHYGRFTITGTITSGREIRKLIEEKKVTGWDDPSLVTMKALKRRGFVKESFRELVYQAGLSLAQTNIDWTVLSTINRQILDPIADRYFFIKDPVKITISGTPSKKIQLKLHPDNPDKGMRDFSIDQDFYIEKKDMESLEEGKPHRLMDCINFRKTNNGFEFISESYEDFKDKNGRIMHWLPANDNNINVEIMKPDRTLVKGLGEASLNKIENGEIIQFTRFGFCRLDNKINKGLGFIFTHK